MRAIRYLLDLEEMSCSIAEIEGDGKGVPVLLRQYLRPIPRGWKPIWEKMGWRGSCSTMGN